MNKIIALTAVLMGILFAMGGCSQEQTKSQVKEPEIKQAAAQPSEQVKADLAKYLSAEEQVMKPWANVIKLTEELPQAKTAKEYSAKLRKEFVPLVTGVIARMEAIKPATKEIQDIHNSFLASIKDYLSGLQSMADAVEKSDDAAVNAAAAKLNAFGAAQAKFLESTNALANKNNIVTQK